MRTAVMAVSDISRIDFKGPRKLQVGQEEAGRSRIKRSHEFIYLIVGKSTPRPSSWLYVSLSQLCLGLSGYIGQSGADTKENLARRNTTQGRLKHLQFGRR